MLIVVTLTLGIGTLNAQETISSSTMDETSSTNTSNKRGPIFRPTKDQIMQVQKILKKKKLYSGDASGKYNDETRAGIKVFQKDNGLKPTGTLNRATLEAFKVKLTDAQKAIPASPNSYVLAEGDKTPRTSASMTSTEAEEDESAASKPARTIFRANKEQVSAAQRLLKEGDMYDGEITGRLNDDTRKGLREFQKAKGIKVTGTLNALTLETMGIELTDKQKAQQEAAQRDD